MHVYAQTHIYINICNHIHTAFCPQQRCTTAKVSFRSTHTQGRRTHAHTHTHTHTLTLTHTPAHAQTDRLTHSLSLTLSHTHFR